MGFQRSYKTAVFFCSQTMIVGLKYFLQLKSKCMGKINLLCMFFIYQYTTAVQDSSGIPFHSSIRKKIYPNESRSAWSEYYIWISKDERNHIWALTSLPWERLYAVYNANISEPCRGGTNMCLHDRQTLCV